MPDQVGSQLVVDAEEEAYLRRSFRRFALPYLTGAVMLTAFACAWVMLHPTRAETVLVTEGELDASGVDQLRTEVLALRAQLSKTHEKLEEIGTRAGGAERRLSNLERRVEEASKSDGLSPRDLAGLDKRIDEAGRRIGALEAREKRVKESLSVAVPPDAAAADVIRSALERIYNIELRQEKAEAERHALQKDLLDRVYNLESRRDQQTGERSQLDESLLERLKNLEDRFFQLEETAGSPGSSGAPAGTPGR